MSSYARFGAAMVTAWEVLGVAYDVRGNHVKIDTPRPNKFLEKIFRATGRNVAIAVSFLQTDDRRESRVAYLACRSLDAYEDLAASPGDSARLLREAADFLAGRIDQMPDTARLVARNPNDELEIQLVNRLAQVRQELENLPAERRERVGGLIHDISDAMARHAVRNQVLEEDRWTYAGEVLGRACDYVFELLAITPETPVDTQTLGLILQTANDLRDLDQDSRPTGCTAAEFRWLLLLDAAAYGVCVPAILDQLSFCRWSRSRGAVAFMSATSARFLYRHIGLPLPLIFRFPLLFAFVNVFSPGAFKGLLNVLASLAVTPAGTLLDSGERPPSGRFRRQLGEQARWENDIILHHPRRGDGLRLFRALQMFQAGRSLLRWLDSKEHSASLKRRLSLAGDFLFARALRETDPLGTKIIAGFSDLGAHLSEIAEQQGSVDDREGDVAAYLAGLVADANRADPMEREQAVANAKYHSQQCYLRDRSISAG